MLGDRWRVGWGADADNLAAQELAKFGGDTRLSDNVDARISQMLATENKAVTTTKIGPTPTARNSLERPPPQCDRLCRCDWHTRAWRMRSPCCARCDEDPK